MGGKRYTNDYLRTGTAAQPHEENEVKRCVSKYVRKQHVSAAGAPELHAYSSENMQELAFRRTAGGDKKSASSDGRNRDLKHPSV